MSSRRDHETLSCGFIPLTDCATLAVAHELGFTAEEGVHLQLHRETSWSNIRDKMALGLFDVAHMLAPMPIAMSLGLSTFPSEVSAPFVLSVNGNTIGVSAAFAQRLGGARSAIFSEDAASAAAALKAACDGAPLRIGAPWTFSMHAVLLDYWLGASGFTLDRDTRTSIVPPPYMAEALGAGEIDLFCVGEPWGSIAVESGSGALLLAGASIWAFAPEKVLGVRDDVLAARPDAMDALLRALYRAARWASRAEHRAAVAEILARPEYVDAPAEVIERALRGALVVAPSGEIRHLPRALELFDAAATFPWRSQASWIAAALARRHQLDGLALDRAGEVWRPDVYRRALAPISALTPTASAKVEGALAEPMPAMASGGDLVLGPDVFFDGARFDPDAHELSKT